MQTQTTPPFESTFLVPLSCDSCVDDIRRSLEHRLGPGQLAAFSADVPGQLVRVAGAAPPSAIAAAIRATGRDAIIRGSGRPNGAAVAILEAPVDLSGVGTAAGAAAGAGAACGAVNGLARFVQVAFPPKPAPDGTPTATTTTTTPTASTMVDLTLSGLRPHTAYSASVNSSGDITRGPASTGPVWPGNQPAAAAATTADRPVGDLGTLTTDELGAASAFVARDFAVWEIVGRSVVVRPADGGADGTLVGVVARSAGIWENDKVVCSCSGKTVWQERAEMRAKGVA